MPVPGYGDNCSMAQKLLIWRALQPETVESIKLMYVRSLFVPTLMQFSEAIRDFILLTFGAAFSKTHPCTVASILPYTNSTTPTLCYFCNDVAFTKSLEAAHSDVCSVALIDDQHLATIESRLSDLMQDGYWIVVENLQLCRDPSGILSSLNKVHFYLYSQQYK